MNYLIDTNVISELRRKVPDPDVIEWFRKCPSTSLFLSVLTLGELRKGVEKLGDGERRMQLLNWLEMDLPNFFTGRLLPIDAAVADCWGKITAKVSRPVAAIDSLLAATAIHHGLSFVTRNVKDVECFELDIINPWGK